MHNVGQSLSCPVEQADYSACTHAGRASRAQVDRRLGELRGPHLRVAWQGLGQRGGLLLKLWEDVGPAAGLRRDPLLQGFTHRCSSSRRWAAASSGWQQAAVEITD